MCSLCERMSVIIIYIIINIGLTIIVTKSKIFKKIREYLCKISPNFFGYLFSCPMCFGFWAGVLTSLVIFSPTLLLNPLLNPFLASIFDGFFISPLCYITFLLIKPLMDKFD